MQERGRRAAERIRASAKGVGGEVRVMTLDVSSLASVRAFAKEFIALKLPLHVLV